MISDGMRSLWRRLGAPAGGAPAVDRGGRIDLHYAAADGDLKRMKALLRSGADPNHQDGEGFTPLHFAAMGVQAEAADLLLKAGARVDVVDAWGNQPLFRAAFESEGDCRVIHVLLNAGADPDHKNLSGKSARDVANLIANYDVRRCFERT